MELSKAYDPKKVEDRIYNLWQKSGFFNPDKLPCLCQGYGGQAGKRKKTYTIVIPPPNITGSLHMGHALNATCQDVLIRWRRLQGYKTLWLPGTDHAGIATQNVVEKELKKQGLTRFDLGKEKFLEKVWQWKEKYGNIILEQFKKIGSSLDWSRTRFTMDKEYCQAVKTAFLHYHKKGWIYRAKRVVNWCSRCQTSLSDLELEYEEEKGSLWFIRYPLTKPCSLYPKPYIVVATTRPETMLGDTAVAVNPGDERYEKIVGEKVILPLVNEEIPIITDKLVDPKFGTGALKVTPAHDLADYEIRIRHNLKSVQVIDELGQITKDAPLAYRGLKILEAREKVIDNLKKFGFLEKVEEYLLSVPKCYRCGTKTELIPSEQWFLKMNDLAKMAKSPVKRGEIKFYPKSFEKGYFDWLSGMRDWCLSRQLWWGHKIPIEGVEDVLDTWFSSALWPFATLGWPKETKDLKNFYPTNVLITDRGIINLWVTRMIFSGMEFLKKPPFKDVYINATVLTREGRRMSKSLGTGVDPINLIEKYGADATRFGIIYQVMGGQDVRFVEDNIVMGRKFCNKIWNASRFVLQQITGKNLAMGKMNKKCLTRADKKILEKLNKTTVSVNKDLEGFRFGQAAHKLYNFFWHDFCDKYIEQAKIQMTKSKPSTRAKLGTGLVPHRNEVSGAGFQTKKVLLYTLLTSLKLLHPFVPFITEEIYQKLPIKNRGKSLMVENWPNN